MIAILGIAYILFLGYQLLSCFLSGLGPLPASEVPLYTLKCFIMAFALPTLIYWYAASNYYLSDELEKSEDTKAEYERELAEYKQLLHLLAKQHKSLIAQHETTIAEMDALSRNKVVNMSNTKAYQSWNANGNARTNKQLLIPTLVSAYTGKQKLSPKEKQELIKYLEEL